MKDYYKILGVESTATDKEIKKAYKKLSMKYHPDRPGGSEEKFKEINEAHDVLMDPIKRMQFNQGQKPTGSNPENGDFYEDPMPGPRFNRTNPSGFNFSQFSSGPGSSFGRTFFGGGAPFEGMFNDDDFNGFGFPFQSQKEREPEQIVHLSLEEMFRGGIQKLSYGKPVVIDGKTVNINDTTDFKVPAKCYAGKKFKFTIPGEDKRSVIIKIEPKEHKYFKLRKNQLTEELSDLEMTMPMSLKTSLVGFRIKMKGVDGEQIVLDDNMVIDPRVPYRLDGKGFVNKSGARGDLYIYFDIKYPNKLSEKQRKMLKNIL